MAILAINAIFIYFYDFLLVKKKKSKTSYGDKICDPCPEFHEEYIKIISSVTTEIIHHTLMENIIYRSPKVSRKFLNN